MNQVSHKLGITASELVNVIVEDVMTQTIAYLIQKPGQRAKIACFIDFLSSLCNSGLNFLSVDIREVEKFRKHRFERMLLTLLESEEEYEERRWIGVAVAYFHNASLPYGERLLRSGTLHFDEQGVSLATAGDVY